MLIILIVNAIIKLIKGGVKMSKLREAVNGLNLLSSRSWGSEFTFEVRPETIFHPKKGNMKTEVLVISKNGYKVAVGFRYKHTRLLAKEGYDEEYVVLTHENHGMFFIQKSDREGLFG